MPSAAAYQATAGSIYDPQAASESTAAGAQRDASVSALQSQDKQIDPYYTTAENTLKTAKNDTLAKNDFAATNALGGNSSGLESNANARTNADYLTSLSGLTTEQANKHADIASAETLANSQYQSALTSITQKYSGLKSGYVADMLNQDAQQAFQERMASNNAALQTHLAQIQAAAYTQGNGNNNNAPTVARNAVGGYAVKDASGKNMTLGAYVNATGGNMNTLADMLSKSGDKTDQKVAKLIQSGANRAALQKQYPEIFGGT